MVYLQILSSISIKNLKKLPASHGRNACTMNEVCYHCFMLYLDECKISFKIIQHIEDFSRFNQIMWIKYPMLQTLQKTGYLVWFVFICKVDIWELSKIIVMLLWEWYVCQIFSYSITESTRRSHLERNMTQMGILSGIFFQYWKVSSSSLTFCFEIRFVWMNSESFHWSDMPKEYIYEPWTAPKSIQVKAKCVIGKDYPSPGECSNHINLKMHQADVQISLKSLPNFLVGWFNDNSLEQIYLAVHYSRLEPDLCVVKITSISETIDLLRHTF